ncbi:helix-turn-helix domain-containing protein [uncultured Desulfobacter sp.]|uniref:helix-turn-helix domain-containing protein n=1 Tax=uncultured Desulfobacter sp. TaxID=240139 RepID=UPI002AA5E91D|nr:helix-turn-helix domain-containing protein [uncultured Desulfobacter sp.]
MILSKSNRLNFSTILEQEGNLLSPGGSAFETVLPDGILSVEDLQILERENMIRALRYCNWKIYNTDGAAGLLGIKPTTLIEKMKRMKIKKPRK